MKGALYYKKLEEKKVHCLLCPTSCIISPGNFGNCGARKNIDGTLYSMVYAKPISVAIDPIEKKPLYHFLPGSKSFSIGTLGCNLHCLHCQNYETSQAKADQYPVLDVPPEEIVEKAIQNNCKSISYTYNEPTIFYEYVLETAKLARKKGIKNVMVSNGYINEEPLKELYPYIDAANIDIKSFDEKFYSKICSAALKPILESIINIKKIGTWLEITNLVIPGHNDNFKEIGKMCRWLIKNLGEETPLHFSAFHPTYKLLDAERTPPETLTKARILAKKLGLKHVYIGNALAKEGNNTYCQECGKLLIEREWFDVLSNKIKQNRCPDCRSKIAGVFE